MKRRGAIGKTVSPDVGKATQFKPGVSGNPKGPTPKLETVISKAMVREAGSIAPSGNTYAADIAQNAMLALAKGLEVAAQTGKLDNSLIVMYELYQSRIEGKPVQPVKDLTDSVESRPDDDLRYWLTHKHWPDEPCVCPVPPIGESPSKSVQ